MPMRYRGQAPAGCDVDAANQVPTFMAPAFSADSRTLDRLLADPYVFRVPDYQRSYSWTTKEAGQLIDDVVVACGETGDPSDPDQGYFLGAVLLMEAAGDPVADAASGGLRSFDIIDGQQRLITLTILLAVLRDLAEDRELALDGLVKPLIETANGRTQPRFRIVPRGPEGAFLEAFVQEAGGALEMPEEEVLSEGQTRILMVREHFAEVLIDLDDDELKRLARFLCAACHFAVVTTRTIDRAHRIFSVLNERGRPLARNDILKAQILGALPAAERAAGSDRWTAMEVKLDGAVEELFSHIRAIEGPNRGTIISGVGAVVTQAGGPTAFCRDILDPYAAIFASIRSRGERGGNLSPAVHHYLSYLSWFGSSEWIPALMRYWKACDGDQDKLAAFLTRYDRLAFGLRLLGVGADKRLARYMALLHRIRASANLDDQDSPLEFSRDEQRNILYNLRGIHARSQLTCKLLLLRLNDVMAGTPQHLDPADYTVEHVLPQKPGRNSQWRTWFPLADDRESSTQSLGNLVLVTREQNDRARNMELAKKLDVYFGRGAKPLHITRDLEKIPEWRREQVVEREQKLLALVHGLWQFGDGQPAGPVAPQATSAGVSRRRGKSRRS